MFDSKINAKDFISELSEEADIAYPIPEKTYILWLNALERLLYTEVIKEQAEILLEDISDSEVVTEELPVKEGESPVRFENIYAVYADETQLIKSTVASAPIFTDTYYKKDNKLGFHFAKKPDKLKIIYFVCPEAKTEENYEEKNIMLPVEFTELAKAKLRGEAYKLANEDVLAAKWINDYNAILETFKSWISDKSPEFGI